MLCWGNHPAGLGRGCLPRSHFRSHKTAPKTAPRSEFRRAKAARRKFRIPNSPPENPNAAGPTQSPHPSAEALRGTFWEGPALVQQHFDDRARLHLLQAQLRLHPVERARGTAQVYSFNLGSSCHNNSLLTHGKWICRAARAIALRRAASRKASTCALVCPDRPSDAANRGPTPARRPGPTARARGDLRSRRAGRSGGDREPGRVEGQHELLALHVSDAEAGAVGEALRRVAGQRHAGHGEGAGDETVPQRGVVRRFLPHLPGRQPRRFAHSDDAGHVLRARARPSSWPPPWR